MSKTIKELRMYVDDCQRNGRYIEPRKAALKIIDSLSPNVFKHIKIAELQDELVQMGFEYELQNRRFNIYRIDSMRDDNFYHVQFWNEYAYVRDELFYYDSPTFHEDVINKVKELMK